MVIAYEFEVPVWLLQSSNPCSRIVIQLQFKNNKLISNLYVIIVKYLVLHYNTVELGVASRVI